MKKTCLAVLIFLTVGMLGCGNSQELLNEETVNNENSSGKVQVEFMK